LIGRIAYLDDVREENWGKKGAQKIKAGRERE